MLIISMPTTALIQRLDTLLEVLYRNSLECSRDGMSYARINFPIPENGRGMHEKCLKNMILRDSVQDRQMLGTELDDGHCLAVMTRYFPSRAELGCVVDCDFEDGDCGARQEKCAG